ncbi:Crp/Fnr family transcriptional regulator [Chryseobacterium wanjuense]
MISSQLTQEIFHTESFAEEEIDSIAYSITEVLCKKGQVILTEGQQATHLYFVYSGCLRIFAEDIYGKEYTLRFACAGSWITDYTAFYESGFTSLNIECLQDSVLYLLPKRNLESLSTYIPKIEKFYRGQMEHSLTSLQKKLIFTMMYSAQERYKMFVATYSHLIKIVKDYHIASYLGITPESLCRLKKALNRKIN